MKRLGYVVVAAAIVLVGLWVLQECRDLKLGIVAPYRRSSMVASAIWCGLMAGALSTSRRHPGSAGVALVVTGFISSFVGSAYLSSQADLVWDRGPQWMVLTVFSGLPLLAGHLLIAASSRVQGRRALTASLALLCVQTWYWWLYARHAVWNAMPAVMASIQDFRDLQMGDHAGEAHETPWFVDLCEEAAWQIDQEVRDRLASAIAPYGARLSTASHSPDDPQWIDYCPRAIWLPPFQVEVVTRSYRPGFCPRGFRTTVVVLPGKPIVMDSALAWIE